MPITAIEYDELATTIRRVIPIDRLLRYTATATADHICLYDNNHIQQIITYDGEEYKLDGFDCESDLKYYKYE